MKTHVGVVSKVTPTVSLPARQPLARHLLILQQQGELKPGPSGEEKKNKTLSRLLKHFFKKAKRKTGNCLCEPEMLNTPKETTN